MKSAMNKVKISKLPVHKLKMIKSGLKKVKITKLPMYDIKIIKCAVFKVKISQYYLHIDLKFEMIKSVVNKAKISKSNV